VQVIKLLIIFNSSPKAYLINIFREDQAINNSSMQKQKSDNLELFTLNVDKYTNFPEKYLQKPSVLIHTRTTEKELLESK